MARLRRLSVRWDGTTTKATWAAAAIATLAWGGVMSARLLRARSLMRSAKPFSQSPSRPNERVVIAGDSTAVGVGSSHPRLSVAGRLGMALSRAEVINVAQSGARLAQVGRQLDKVGTVSLAVVLCGGNDIVRGGSRRRIGATIDSIVVRIREMGGRLILVPPCIVGRAPIWLPPLSWYYTWRARSVRRAMFEAARKHPDVDVVDLTAAGAGHRFERKRELFARDRLHPSDLGYGAWFERIVQQSARLQAKLAGPLRVLPIRSAMRAKATRWSPHILRAAVR